MLADEITRTSPIDATPAVMRPNETNSFAENNPSDLEALLESIQVAVQAIQEQIKRSGSSEEPDPLLTRDEAAERLSISTRKLDDMADRGEIQPVRIGGRVLYAPDTLEAFIRRKAGEGRK